MLFLKVGRIGSILHLPNTEDRDSPPYQHKLSENFGALGLAETNSISYTSRSLLLDSLVDANIIDISVAFQTSSLETEVVLFLSQADVSPSSGHAVHR
jgi:hypothetical protein